MLEDYKGRVNVVTESGNNRGRESPLAAVNAGWSEKTGCVHRNREGEEAPFFEEADYAFTTFPHKGQYPFHMFVKILGVGDEELFDRVCAARSKVEGVDYSDRKPYVNEARAHHIYINNITGVLSAQVYI